MIENTGLPQGSYSVPQHEVELFMCFHQVNNYEDALWKFLLYQQKKGNLEKYRKKSTGAKNE